MRRDELTRRGLSSSFFSLVTKRDRRRLTQQDAGLIDGGSVSAFFTGYPGR
jgi:hypothetical protein